MSSSIGEKKQAKFPVGIDIWLTLYRAKRIRESNLIQILDGREYDLKSADLVKLYATIMSRLAFPR